MRTITITFPPGSTILEWYEQLAARHGIDVNTVVVTGLVFHIAATEAGHQEETE